MFFSKLSSAFVLAAIYFCVTVVAQGPNCTRIYHYHVGEFIGSILYHLGTTLQNLRECNPNLITESDGLDSQLYDSRVLHHKLDGREQPNWTCQAAPPYTVRKGDTCESIAAALGIDVGIIYFCNDIIAGCINIYPGQELTIAANWNSDDPDRKIYDY